MLLLNKKRRGHIIAPPVEPLDSRLFGPYKRNSKYYALILRTFKKQLS